MSLLRQIVQLPIKQSKLTCVVIQTRGAAGGGKKAKGSVGKTKKVLEVETDPEKLTSGGGGGCARKPSCSCADTSASTVTPVHAMPPGAGVGGAVPPMFTTI